MQRDIKQVWFLAFPPEEVWEMLTDPDLIARWLMENDFQPVAGHKFHFGTTPKSKFGFDGIIYCEVLEVIPLKKLSYSWKGGPGNGAITLDTVLTWSLTPKDNGTEVLLEHTGFKGIRNYFTYIFMNEGWKKNVKSRFIKLLISRDHEPAGS